MRHTAHFVEDLSVRSETPIGRMLAIDEIEPDPTQPRLVLGDLSDLVQSIEDKGMLEPILVRANPEREEGAKPYRIISGERRYRAALEAGLIEVPAIEMEVEGDEAAEIALIENLQRRDLNPFEEADGYRRLAEGHGYTHDQIANAVGKSRTVITESLGLLEMPAEVRDAAVALDVTTKSTLVELLKLTDDSEELIALLEKIAAQGWSRDDLRALVAEQRRERARGAKARGGRRQPYTFKFKSPDKTFTLSMSFRRSEVDRADLIAALEEILGQLQQGEDPI